MGSIDDSGYPTGTVRPRRLGRRPSTSKAELSHIALQLFDERGFDETTVDEIAWAAGIGRRTFFRYFASKNDVPWGEFDAHLEGMRATLRAAPVDRPVLEVLHRAVLDFNRFPPDEASWHRRRMALILRTPALQAHSTLRYAAWRDVVAEYVAYRAGKDRMSLVPQSVAYAFLGVAIAAYEQWLAREDSDLELLLDDALRLLVQGFPLP
jgi:TetR/AcrR family transcriptional regulator, regulator of mycofactocin system